MDTIAAVISDFSTWLWNKILYLLGYFIGFISSLIFKCYSLVSDFFNNIVNFYTDLKESLYNFLHINYLIDLINSLNQTSFGYFFDYFGGNQLLVAFVSGYLFRFAVRRLPIIG